MTALVTYRAIVRPDDCDFLGHMNASRYIAFCADGVFSMQAEMGLTAEDVRSGRRLSLAVVHCESFYKAELLAGDAFRLESEIVRIGEKSITFRHRLILIDGEVEAFEALFKCALLNLETRRAARVPDDVRERAQAWLAPESA